MTDSLVQLFVNPTAGRGRAGKRLSRIEALLGDAGVTFETHLSNEVGDLERQVREAVDGGADRIIVGGGDGSVHEAVNGIMAAGASAKLGVIPTGTGNDFAKASEIPLDWEHATALLGSRVASDANWRRIDKLLGRSLPAKPVPKPIPVLPTLPTPVAPTVPAAGWRWVYLNIGFRVTFWKQKSMSFAKQGSKSN